MSLEALQGAYRAAEKRYIVPVEIHMTDRHYQFEGHGSCYTEAGQPKGNLKRNSAKLIRVDPERKRALVHRTYRHPDGRDREDHVEFWADGIVRQYRVYADGRSPRGSVSWGIHNPEFLETLSPTDRELCLLGVALSGAGYPDAFRAADYGSLLSDERGPVARDSAGMYVLSREETREDVRTSYRLVVDPEKGFFPVCSYREDHSPKGSIRGGGHEGERFRRFARECQGLYREPHGLWFPKKVLYVNRFEDLNGRKWTAWTEITLNSVEVKPEFPDDAFAFLFPAGAKIDDALKE